jgi:hypothetical protein
MNSHANAVAFRTLLVLSLSIAALAYLRSVLPNLIRWSNSTTVRPSQAPASNFTAGLEACGPVAETSSNSVEASAIRPVVVRQAPIPAPRITGIEVGPDGWSSPISIPLGAQVGIRFSMNKVRVEKNGLDIGVLHRNPIFVPSDESPTAVRVRPFAMLNRVPREVWFKQDVQVLRFRGEDKQTGKISILWR